MTMAIALYLQYLAAAMSILQTLYALGSHNQSSTKRNLQLSRLSQLRQTLGIALAEMVTMSYTFNTLSGRLCDK